MEGENIRIATHITCHKRNIDIGDSEITSGRHDISHK